MLTPHECARTAGTPEAARLYKRRVSLARQMEVICLDAALRGWATKREMRRFHRLCARVDLIDAQLTDLMEACVAS